MNEHNYLQTAHVTHNGSAFKFLRLDFQIEQLEQLQPACWAQSIDDTLCTITLHLITPN